MDQTVQEFDGATGTWVTAAEPVVETPAVAVPDVATPATEAVVDVVTPPVEAKGKPRNDPRARVEQATAKEAEAKRERDAAKAEAAELKTRLATLEARTAPKVEPPKPPTAVADAEPTVDQFDSYEKFVDARARWAAKQEWDSRERTRSEQQAQQVRDHAVREVDRQFYERYSKVVEADPDFESNPALDQRLLNTKRLGVLTPEERAHATLGNVLVEHVFHCTHPKEMLLHLSNREEVQRLATLPPQQLTWELARIDAGFGAASPRGPVLKPQPVSRAKPPIQPLGSSPLVTDDEPGEDASDDEWYRHYQAAELKKRRAGRG